MIVFLGPDGSGKSSVIAGVIALLESKFKSVHCFHLRPRFGNEPIHNPKETVDDPHGLPNRPPLMSTLKLLYFWLDYTVSYWLKLRLLENAGGLILFDRYYHDLLIDPRRYRFGEPMSLARWIGKQVPQPALILLLDAPAEVLHQRKQEVSLEETHRQREAYRRFVSACPQGAIIDASKPLPEVIREAAQTILDRIQPESR